MSNDSSTGEGDFDHNTNEGHDGTTILIEKVFLFVLGVWLVVLAFIVKKCIEDKPRESYMVRKIVPRRVTTSVRKKGSILKKRLTSLSRMSSSDPPANVSVPLQKPSSEGLTQRISATSERTQNDPVAETAARGAHLQFEDEIDPVLKNKRKRSDAFIEADQMAMERLRKLGNLPPLGVDGLPQKNERRQRNGFSECTQVTTYSDESTGL